MFDQLEGGQLRLTPGQRMWADQIYEKLKLEDKPPSRFKTLQSKGLPDNTPYDEMVKRRPLKPPGRK